MELNASSTGYRDFRTFYIGCPDAVSSVLMVSPALFHMHARSQGKHVALRPCLYDWYAPAAL